MKYKTRDEVWTDLTAFANVLSARNFKVLRFSSFCEFDWTVLCVNCVSKLQTNCQSINQNSSDFDFFFFIYFFLTPQIRDLWSDKNNRQEIQLGQYNVLISEVIFCFMPLNGRVFMIFIRCLGHVVPLFNCSSLEVVGDITWNRSK